MSTSSPSAHPRIPSPPLAPVEVTAAMPDPDFLRVDTNSLPVIRDTQLVAHRHCAPNSHNSRVQQSTQQVNDH